VDGELNHVAPCGAAEAWCEQAPNWRFLRAATLAEARLDDVCVTDLAGAAGISTVHLNSLFRRTTGFSPHQWILRRRLQRAGALLADGGLSVTDIAYQCGFATSQHLATSFRKQFGMTPTRYRRLARAGLA
jgi:AraC family transcriptional regulator